MLRSLVRRSPFAALAAAALLAALAGAPPAAAHDTSTQETTAAGAAQAAAAVAYQSTFCDGTYALCIKAPCSAIPTLDRLGNYYVEHALCECNVVDGWSMGPGSCPDRAPMEQNGRTYLISTYSNLYNAEENTLTCPDDTTWAWCYGAPCVIDEADPSKATCTCPVETSAASTLGGDCKAGACEGIWSAATVPGDVFANKHYYEWMQRHQPGVSVNPPAAACPTTASGGGE